ncbi:MAG: hypothetical protein WCD35_16800 [Mycobacteriales bacterium]
MLWVLLDISVCLLAVAALGLSAARLYRHTRALARDVSTASSSIGELTAALPAPEPRLQPAGHKPVSTRR